MYDANQAILQKIVDQSLKRSIGKIEDADAGEIRISALYRSFMDETAIEARGLEPLEDILHLIRRIDSGASLARVWGVLAANHYSLEPTDRMVATNPFLIEFWPNDRDPKKWSPFLYPSGLGLPGTSYYTPQDRRGQDILGKYHEHIRAITAAAHSQYSKRAVRQF
jgi:predicted metalloendopeptidase